MPTIYIKLPAALERFLSAEVKHGKYPSREAAIIAAVDRERRRTEQRARLTFAIQKGMNSGSAGELSIQDVIRRGRKRAAAGKRRARIDG